MSEIIDLDVLVPQSVTVRIGGQNIEIKPPRMEDMLSLASLGTKLQGAAELPPEELAALTDDLAARIKKCLPALEGQSLQLSQMVKLLDIMLEMATPGDTKDLKEKGITADTGDDDRPKV